VYPLAIIHVLGNVLTNVSLGKVAVSFTHTVKVGVVAQLQMIQVQQIQAMTADAHLHLCPALLCQHVAAACGCSVGRRYYCRHSAGGV
jgi:hypothetical protein